MPTVPVPACGGLPVHGEHGESLRTVEVQVMNRAGVPNRYHLLNHDGLDEGVAEIAAALLRGEEVLNHDGLDEGVAETAVGLLRGEEEAGVLEQPEERGAAREEEEEEEQQQEEDAGVGMGLWVCIGGGAVVQLAAGLVRYDLGLETSALYLVHGYNLGAGLVRVYNLSAGLLLATTAAAIARAAPEQEDRVRRLGLAAWGYRAFLVLLAATFAVRATLRHAFVRPAPVHPFGAAYRDIVADAGMVAWVRGAARLVALLVVSVAAGRAAFLLAGPGHPLTVSRHVRDLAALFVAILAVLVVMDV